MTDDLREGVAVMDERPIWFLDVDGVINAYDGAWVPHSQVTSHMSVGGRRYKIKWERLLVSWIKKLSSAGLVDVRWSSTWCLAPSELERVFNLKLPNAFTVDIPDGVDPCSIAIRMQIPELKLNAVRDALAAGRRVIWTDDDEVPSPWSALHADLTRGGRALLIKPDSDLGLQPEHVDEIERWIKES